MMRALVLALVLAIGGTGMVAEAAPAAGKKRCPKGYKLVGKKRCKKIKKSAITPTAVKTVTGGTGGSFITLIPDAKAKTITVKANISCTQTGGGISISQGNGTGTVVSTTPVLNLQQTFKGSVSDPSGAAVTWQATGLWKTPTRWEGILSGTANAPGENGFPGPGCSLPQTNVVLS